MADKKYLYSVRDVATGKLVTNITNPGRRYWEKKGTCQKAIDAYNNSTPRWRRYNYDGPLELVTFELVEVNE